MAPWAKPARAATATTLRSAPSPTPKTVFILFSFATFILKFGCLILFTLARYAIAACVRGTPQEQARALMHASTQASRQAGKQARAIRSNGRTTVGPKYFRRVTLQRNIDDMRDRARWGGGNYAVRSAFRIIKSHAII